MSDEDLFAQLEDVFAAVDAAPPIDYTTWETFDLLDELEEVTQDIKNLRQILHPRTEEARDLHSRRAALVIELSNRGVTH